MSCIEIFINLYLIQLINSFISPFEFGEYAPKNKGRYEIAPSNRSACYPIILSLFFAQYIIISKITSTVLSIASSGIPGTAGSETSFTR